VLTSSGGAGTTPTKTLYRRTNMAGARRLGGCASPGFVAGKATPGMTPPTGAGLVPGGPPCSPECSTDSGATPKDPDDDILALVLDAFILPLAFVWDALPFYLRPPPRPDLLQGTRWELGMVGLARSPTGIRCTPVEQDKVGGGGGGGGARVDSLSHRRVLSSSLLPRTTRAPSPNDPPPPPKVHTRARGTGRPRDRGGRKPGPHATTRDPRDTEASRRGAGSGTTWAGPGRSTLRRELCRITRPVPRPLDGQEVDGAPGDADDVSRPGSDRWRCRCWLGS